MEGGGNFTHGSTCFVRDLEMNQFLFGHCGKALANHFPPRIGEGGPGDRPWGGNGLSCPMQFKAKSTRTIRKTIKESLESARMCVCVLSFAPASSTPSIFVSALSPAGIGGLDYWGLGPSKCWPGFQTRDSQAPGQTALWLGLELHHHDYEPNLWNVWLWISWLFIPLLTQLFSYWL